MKQKHIDASREVRLWIGQIIIPAVMLAGTIIVNNPEMKSCVRGKIDCATNFVKEKFYKKRLEGFIPSFLSHIFHLI